MELIHPEMAGVKKSVIKQEIGKKFKASEDRIAVFGLKAKFGGGKSTGFVTVYDDMDARNKYDTKTNLFKVGIHNEDPTNAIFARLPAIWSSQTKSVIV